MSKLQQQLDIIESRVDNLIIKYRQQQEQNDSLHTRETKLNEERSDLLRKNEMAQSKIESMISHLRMLEQGS